MYLYPFTKNLQGLGPELILFCEKQAPDSPSKLVYPGVERKLLPTVFTRSWKTLIQARLETDVLRTLFWLGSWAHDWWHH